MSKAVLAYVPVLHRGYRDFFTRHKDAPGIFLLGDELIAEFPHLRKEIRALSPQEVLRALEGWQLPSSIFVADKDTLVALRAAGLTIVMPDEDICRDLAEKYLPGYERVEFDSIFLRWDRKNSLLEKGVSFDREVPLEGFVRRAMDQAFEAGARSSDWWRQIGAIITRDEEILVTGWNHHLPTDHAPYFDGDPRNNFKRGIHIEISTAVHAEAEVIGMAAREGISVKGTSLFITTFPCPPCAKLIRAAGIAHCYYAEGYGMLDAEQVLKSAGVEIIHVEMNSPLT